MSRHGDAVATFIFSEGARLESAPAFAQLHTFPTLNGGLVFDATRDLVYGTSVPASSFNSQIIAYDTTTYAEKFRFDVGEVLNSGASRFGPGLLVASPDGQRLAVRTNNDTRIFSIPGVQLVSVASLKMHGAAEFSVPLPLDPPRAVESRSGGAAGAYTMVFLFGEDLVSVGGATVTSGIGTVASGSIDPGNRRRYIVNLAGVTNQQYPESHAQRCDWRGGRTHRADFAADGHPDRRHQRQLHRERRRCDANPEPVGTVGRCNYLSQ